VRHTIVPALRPVLPYVIHYHPTPEKGCAACGRAVPGARPSVAVTSAGKREHKANKRVRLGNGDDLGFHPPNE
jgi:hypothetical protein